MFSDPPIKSVMWCQGGGVLDPAASLKIADLTGKAGAEKAVEAMGSMGSGTKKKRRGKDQENETTTTTAKQAHVDLQCIILVSSELF